MITAQRVVLFIQPNLINSLESYWICKMRHSVYVYSQHKYRWKKTIRLCVRYLHTSKICLLSWDIEIANWKSLEYIIRLEKSLVY